jgi:hypothetical protein
VHIKNYLLQGITTPFLYYAERKNKACVWHCEDSDLLSINFLHYGDPKIWYTIPRMEAGHFDEVINIIIPTNCSNQLRHKNILIPLSIFEGRGIKVYKLIQKKNDCDCEVTIPRGIFHIILRF